MGQWSRMARAWQKFYWWKAWLACRGSYIDKRRAIDGAMCEACKDKPGYIVDHVIEINALNYHDPLITLNHDNLQYLCLECHNSKTFGTPARVTFDPDGNVVTITDD